MAIAGLRMAWLGGPLLCIMGADGLRFEFPCTQCGFPQAFLQTLDHTFQFGLVLPRQLKCLRLLVTGKLHGRPGGFKLGPARRQFGTLPLQLHAVQPFDPPQLLVFLDHFHHHGSGPRGRRIPAAFELGGTRLQPRGERIECILPLRQLFRRGFILTLHRFKP